MTVVGVTGHQHRPEIDWTWVHDVLAAELLALGATKAVSSLAAGADQCFASAALALQIPHTAVVPLPDYERYFHGTGHDNYRHLLDHSDVVNLPGEASEQASFFRAGTYIVDHCDVLIALWDQKPSVGFGGTADVVQYARAEGRSLTIFNPITKTRITQ